VDDMKNEALEPYIDLIGLLLNDSINAPQFESRFLQIFKSESTTFPPDVFHILDELFAAVDAFCPDPELCDEHDLNEKQLRSKATESLAILTTK
jgi:hypothetical protein